MNSIDIFYLTNFHFLMNSLTILASLFIYYIFYLELNII